MTHDAVDGLEPRQIAGMGWKRDTPDSRDLLYRAPRPVLASLPASVALPVPYIRDQGDLGCCTGFGTTSVLEFVRLKQGLRAMMPSPLFVYWNERYLEGTVDSDSGAEIRDGLKVLASVGCCTEAAWPYHIAKYREKPSTRAYASAVRHEALLYSRVDQHAATMKACLAEGYPIVVGISVYESFESQEVARTGTVPMPEPGERLLGGHCIWVNGYDDELQTWKLVNSWGDAWGNKGCFTLPYGYLENPRLGGDYWTVKLTKG